MRLGLNRRFDLGLTLRSGQFFRFAPDGDGFLISDGDRVFRCRQAGRDLEIDGTDEAHARRLFGLDGSHVAALRAFAADAVLAPLLADYGGLRLMRQDPWQCLVSFVCSAMSNMKRIQANVEGIAAAFGRGGAFPRPRPLPAGALRPIRLGWREKYVGQLFATVDPAWLEGLAGREFEDVRAQLMELPGVGVKVAECVMAFSLGFGEACPVDVWIRRIGRRHFFGGRRATDRRIAERLRQRFGPRTALAQQILFAAARDGRL
ncbi:MAG: 8-oxoguanine DNA glycosylase [Planctomycetia bacterium]|nr:8-oxoguanine DNA glycosylase [Planctomycetia bacterium]